MNKYFGYKTDDVNVLYPFTDKNFAIKQYQTEMLNKTINIFEWDGLPDKIPRIELERLLQTNGYIVVTETKDGLRAFYGGLGGILDEYYQPTQIVVANPYLNFDKTIEIKDDTDGVLCRNTSYYMSLLPIHNRYATQFVETDITKQMALINTRIQTILSATNDQTKQSAELFIKQLIEGKMGVIGDITASKLEELSTSGTRLTVSNIPTSSNAMTGLIEYTQYLKASWYNEMGLNANYNMKREAINTTEAQMNNDALTTLITDMLTNREEFCERLNKRYGLNVSVKISERWQPQEVEEEKTEDSEKLDETNQESEVEENADKREV